MGRYRVFAILVLTLGAVISFATDYRLVVASDDPNTRKSPSIVIFEGTGKLTKEDRITSITFSAAADVKPNCLVSLDGTSGKSAMSLSPDVQVYQGKVLIAGAKPTRKVIPAHLEVDVPVASTVKDGKLSSVMQPIIQQVNNLPWVYIAMGIGIFMAIMFFMNKRSQQYTTSMSKEAKNLYLETVGRITERLDRIETSQERLVKNPPVVRTFKTQIEDFEGRLTRIERLAKEGKDEIGRAAAELGQSDKRHDDLVGRLESAKREASATQTSLKQEADALRAELKLLLRGQDEAKAQLQTMDELKAFSLQITEQNRQLEAQLAAQQDLLMKAQDEHLKQLQQLQGEIATLRANQESLLSMPKELELVSASMAKMPAEFESVRSSMPRLDGVEARLDAIEGFGSRFDSVDAKLDSVEGLGARFDSVDNKLEALPEIKNSLDSLPSQFPHVDDALARVHDSILQQIESLTGKISESGASLGELLSAHSFNTPEPAEEEPEAKVETKKSKKGRAKVEEPEVVEEAPQEAVFEEPVLEASPETEVIEEAPESIVEELPEAELEPESVIEEAVKAEPEAIIEDPQPEAAIEEVETVIEEPVLEAAPEVEAVEVIAEELEPEPLAELEIPAEEPLAELEPEPAAELEIPVEEPQAELEPEPIAEMEAPAEEPQVEEPVAEEPAPHQVMELQYRYKEEAPAVPEFHFSNAIKKMTEEEPAVHLKEEETKVGKEAPLTFHLEELPDHLDTFEDDEPDAVLHTLHVEEGGQDYDPLGEAEAVEQALRQFDAPKTVSQDVEAFDADQDECADTHVGHWYGFGGSSARTWGSESSRALELRSFTGELKPLTPIETAPIGEKIGALVYGFGRVVYASGSSVRGFWPGKDERHVSVDMPVPADEWRLAVKGQNLFVAGENKVKIVSIQSWFVLEQFAGQYVDQLITNTRWAGLKHDNGPVVDFRDFRGQMVNEVRLDMDAEGLLLCASETRVFAASKDGRVVEVSQFGTEALGNGPEGGELLHLASHGDAPLAIYRVNGNLECWTFGEEARSASLDMNNYSGMPILLGGKLYLADLQRSELVSLNLKKMQRSSVKALEGVESIRRMVGVQHKSQHELFIITTDSEKKGGRLVMVDAKSGHESCFGSVGQASASLICADHHVVLSTSSQYQNVIRVLEPFAERIAA